jgi:hypothetical protein
MSGSSFSASYSAAQGAQLPAPDCVVRRMPRESGTRGQPQRLHHRQPEREER